MLTGQKKKPNRNNVAIRQVGCFRQIDHVLARKLENQQTFSMNIFSKNYMNKEIIINKCFTHDRTFQIHANELKTFT